MSTLPRNYLLIQRLQTVWSIVRPKVVRVVVGPSFTQPLKWLFWDDTWKTHTKYIYSVEYTRWSTLPLNVFLFQCLFFLISLPLNIFLSQ